MWQEASRQMPATSNKIEIITIKLSSDQPEASGKLPEARI
jgi:hypothetical protein